MDRAVTPSSPAFADTLLLSPSIAPANSVMMIRRLVLVAGILLFGSPVMTIAGAQAGQDSAAAGRQTPTLVAAVKEKPKPGVKANSNPGEDFRACGAEIGEAKFVGCDRAIAAGKLNPKELAFAYASRGGDWLRKGDVEQALADVNQAIRLDPDYQYAYTVKAGVLLARKDPSAALVAAEQAVQIQANSYGYAIRGQVLQALDRRDEAAADYRRVLAENPGTMERRIAEGGLAELAAASDKPVEHLKPSPFGSEPGPSATPAPSPAENTAENVDADSCRTSSGAAAIAACDRAIASGRFTGADLAQLFGKRGDAYRAKQDFDHAIADYDEGLRQIEQAGANKTSKSELLINRGVTQLVKKDFDRAIADLSAAIDIDPSAKFAFYNRGVAQSSKQNYDLAIADFTEAIKLDSHNAIFLLARADDLRSRGRRDEAAADYKRVLAENPGYIDRQIAEAGLAQLAADNAKPAETPKPSPSASGPSPGATPAPPAPENAAANADATSCRDSSGDAAIAACNRAIASGRSTGRELAQLFDRRGNERAGKQDWDGAIEDYSAAIKADPNDALAFSNRGYGWHQKKDYQRTLADENEAIRLGGGNGAIFVLRGEAHRQLGHRDEAVADYYNGLNLHPDQGWTQTAQAGLQALGADPAAVDADASKCRSAISDEMMQACGRAIASNKFVGKELTDLYARHAAAAAKLKNFDLAIADYGALIKLDPLYPNVNLLRGQAYRQKGEYDKAIADYGVALAVNPFDGDARVGRGNSYLAKQDYDRAIADYNEVLRQIDFVGGDKLNKVDPLINRGVAYMGKDDADRAIADFSAAISIDNSSATASQAFLNRGAVYADKQNYDLAIADFAQAIKTDPQKGNALLNGLKLDVVSRQKLQEAVSATDDEYKQCHAQARDATIAACGRVIATHKFTEMALGDLYNQRGGEYYEKGQYELAFADFDEAIRLDPSSSLAYMNRGFTNWATKHYDRAIADFSEDIRLGSKRNDQGYINRGNVYAEIGDRDHALADFGAAIQIHPEEAATYILRGDVLRQAGRRDEAMADYNKALTLKSDDRTRQAAQARLAELANKPAADDDAKKCHDLTGDAAIAACGRVISSGKLSGAALAGVYSSRGAQYYDKDQYDPALADLDKAIQLDPSSAEAYMGRGLVDAAKKNNSRAIADFSEVIRLRPNASLAFVQRGNVYAETGDQAHAIADYGEAIRLEPKLVDAYCGRASAFVATHELRLAFADYKTAVRLDPRYVIAATTATISSGKRTGDALVMTYEVRARAFSAIRDYDHAIADFSEEIRLDPKDAEAYGQRGEARALKGQDDEAIADLSAAIAIDPADADNFDLRGLIYHRKHDLDRAIADYSAAIAIDAKFATALSDRGGAYFDKGDYDRAIADFDAVIKLRPTAGEPHTNKAQALLAKKQPTEALAEANEGVRLTPDDYAFSARGDVFRALGRAKEAKADYDKALTINKDNTIAAEGLKALAVGGSSK
ncbi:MAG: tetratricopeptide repeat protein [Rhodopseudomonas sp.]|uniref:tetratricopeptide repeat protein n=1 Tax=Rhodopseudomonas sp. TaxID=1078 RepID=UPI001796925F|nr:tetratricopeptide repeat protein [Rhodopseudomonas sp.]NVN88279.1 tetratricopeptide repeat protein [Rhodopseudomonas sp.]